MSIIIPIIMSTIITITIATIINTIIIITNTINVLERPFETAIKY